MKHSIKHLPFPKKKAENVSELFASQEAVYSAYADKLLWWNGRINLVSRNVSRETLLLHIMHSLVVSQSSVFKNSDKIIDTGTGGGLPGIPLAIACPEKTFLLNDIAAKKITACKNIASSLSLKNVSAEAGSIAEVEIASQILISKHAFKINELLAMLSQKSWKHIVLLKGGEDVEAELEGVEELLTIEIYDLYGGFQEVFFKGKALVEINRG